MGIKRKMSLLEDFCDMGDYPTNKIDPLDKLSGEENFLTSQRQPLNRSVPFDIDDDIIVTPNFISR